MVISFSFPLFPFFLFSFLFLLLTSFILFDYPLFFIYFARPGTHASACPTIVCSHAGRGRRLWWRSTRARGTFARCLPSLQTRRSVLCACGCLPKAGSRCLMVIKSSSGTWTTQRYFFNFCFALCYVYFSYLLYMTSPLFLLLIISSAHAYLPTTQRTYLRYLPERLR